MALKQDEEEIVNLQFHHENNQLMIVYLQKHNLHLFDFEKKQYHYY
jgi:hypothetical protein